MGIFGERFRGGPREAEMGKNAESLERQNFIDGTMTKRPIIEEEGSVLEIKVWQASTNLVSRSELTNRIVHIVLGSGEYQVFVSDDRTCKADNLHQIDTKGNIFGTDEGEKYYHAKFGQATNKERVEN